MTDRVLFKAYADAHTIAVRTVSARMKSPQRFLILYEELDRLRQEGRIIVSDIHSFAKLRIDEKHDRIIFDFTWLDGCRFDRVDGTEQFIELRWSAFQEFLDTCRLPDGPKEFKAVALMPRRDRPRLSFVGGKANLNAAIADRRIRRKLGKALMANFNYPDADEILLYDDSIRFSFGFQEMRDDRPAMCGGLILHCQEDMEKAYYGIHT